MGHVQLHFADPQRRQADPGSEVSWPTEFLLIEIFSGVIRAAFSLEESSSNRTEFSRAAREAAFKLFCARLLASSLHAVWLRSKPASHSFNCPLNCAASRPIRCSARPDAAQIPLHEGVNTPATVRKIETIET